MLARTREFFAARRVLEVETPALSRAAVSDPHIESLHTRIKGFERPFFLATSAEFAMKRLIAAGAGDIYQICKVFRDGECGRWHNPEFTLLEWYRLGFDDDRLMSEIEQLVGLLLGPQRLSGPALRLTYAQALVQYAGVDPHIAGDAELAAAAVRHGVDCAGDLDRDGKLDLLMALVVGPKLGRDHLTFICDYPASQASLARLKPGAPPVAARFEMYFEGLELANGFHELGAAHEQRSRFGNDLEVRRARGQPLPPLDEHLLSALEAGMPDCAGVALGFDRLVAISLGATALSEVLSFPVETA